MLVTFMKQTHIFSLSLPEKIQGRYWIRDLDARGTEIDLLAIEGICEQWWIRSTPSVRVLFCDPNSPNGIALSPSECYPLQIPGENSNPVLYTEPATADRQLYQQYSFPRGEGLLIGRSSACDIQYSNRFVSSNHAKLRYSGNTWYISDLGSTNGTFANNKAVTEEQVLNIGDVLYVMGLKIIIGDGVIACNNPDGKVKINNASLVPVLAQPPKLPAAPNPVAEDPFRRNVDLEGTVSFSKRHAAKPGAANLVVLEGEQVKMLALDSRPAWRIGRYTPDTANLPDIAFRSNIVSREHGSIQNINGQWYYVENLRNLNGTFYNGVKLPRPLDGVAQPIRLESGDVLRVDSDDLAHVCPQGVLMLFTTVPAKGRWTIYPLKQETTVIGRAESCDIVEPLPYISATHAKISRSDGNYYLSDCNSSAGTFLNGRQIKSSTLLREKDCISLCDCTYLFLGDKLLYVKRDRKREQTALRSTRPNERPVILSADIRSKKVFVSKFPMIKKEKELLRDIRLDIREGTLVAVLGTAGAGKSTLMGCLSGLDQSGVTGTVIYRGVDLIKNLEQIKYLIGNVPQEKVIRPELTPEKAFRESAELRLSAETTKEQIRERVEKTLELLSMTKVRDTLNSRLSGGEQTRVNVGIDLVADRDIYFLDEPEQGLSPNLRDELYVFLRDLAHTHGKTIVAIIHDVSCIDMFDQVIFLVKANGVGRLAFSGTPEEGSKHFGVPISKAYALLEADPEKYVR